jgi:3-dehydroquinate synthetase
VITDLGAFVASTYKRGMGSVLVSTTLLGCVDAAVGGKTAVNLGAAKNMVGTFHAPEAVILDLGSLGTLNKRGLMEGLVEAYKTGLIADEEFASHIELNGPDLLKGDQLGLAQVARRSAEIKAGIVGEDFTEKGKRMLLNFGHTYGHAVEAFYRHKVSHGRCVGLGMEVAARISLGRGMISEDLAERISRTISLLTPKPLAAPPAKDAWPLALQDKKIRNRGVVFILLKGPGQAEPVNDVTEQELDTAIKSVGRQRDG